MEHIHIHRNHHRWEINFMLNLLPIVIFLLTLTLVLSMQSKGNLAVNQESRTTVLGTMNPKARQ